MNFLVIDNDWIASGGSAKGIESTFPDSHVFEASTLEQGFQLLEDNAQITLVVLDLNLKETKGIDTLRQFKLWRDGKNSTVKAVILSGAGSYRPDFVNEVLEDFQTGFIPKGTAIEKFRNALRHTLDNGIYVPEELIGGMVVEGDEPTATNSARALTSKEYEVAHYLVQQLTNKQIAQKLQKRNGEPISEETVRVHIRKIAWKLGVTGQRPKLGVIMEIARRKLKFPLPRKD